MTDPVQYWERAHVDNNVDFLSFSDPKWVLDFHGEKPFRDYVCDFGVGNGDMSRHLTALENTVWCVDIAENALAKCDGKTIRLLTSQLKDAGPFTLFLSTFVFQHLDDDEVVRVLSETRMYPGSVMSIQALCGMSNVYGPHHYSRSEDEFISLVQRSGKRVLNVVHKGKCDCIAEPSQDWEWLVWKVR